MAVCSDCGTEGQCTAIGSAGNRLLYCVVVSAMVPTTRNAALKGAYWMNVRACGFVYFANDRSVPGTNCYLASDGGRRCPEVIVLN